VTGVVLAHLRAATRQDHDRLEGSLGLLDEGLGLDGYRNVLARFHGFWRGWEPRVAELLRDAALTEPRRRQHLLAQDLAALGMTKAELTALPVCPPPSLDGAAAALGSLYVMEGSTLGGAVIRRHVARRLGLDRDSGCAYFSGYGAATGAMWRSFLARLDAQPAAEAERIAAGASATFATLASWLAKS
jgi:heme oxygenase